MKVIAIATKEELEKHLRPLYIIEDYMVDQESYMKFQNSLYNTIKGCFEHKELREYPIRFKFSKKDEKMHTLQFRHFMTNVFLWYPLTHISDVAGVLCEDKIIDCMTEIPDITAFINTKIIHVLQDCSIKNTVINASISKMLHNLRNISNDFALIMNLNMSLNSFTEIYNSSDRMKEIMETRFSEEAQPAEVEEQLNLLGNEAIKLIKEIKNNPIGVILSAKTGMKHKQLIEFIIALGLKPDLTGSTIPKVINTSTLIGGLDLPSSYWIDALGARKSAIMAQNVMGNAGYFGKLLLLLSLTLQLSKSVSDCGSKHYLEIYIKSDKMLKKYNKRYYYNESTNSLSILSYKKDKHLIGETVLFRSPVTCSLQDEVCHKCFGTTSLLNLDISHGVSGFESEEISKVVNQLILSAKHLLSTISEKIEFCPEFSQFFAMYAGEICPKLSNDDNDPNPINIENYVIYINPLSVEKIEELDNDSSSNNFINTRFQVINKLTGDIIDIYSLRERELYLSDECLDLLNKGKGYIEFSDLSEDTSLFGVTILNNELTKPLYDLMSLIKTKKKNVEARESYHTYSQKFTELLVDANIDAMAIAGEIITNRLIRKEDDIDYTRPDFSRKHLESYQIRTLTHCLTKNQSPLIGISSEWIKTQLLSDDIESRRGKSHLDTLFRETYHMMVD